MAKFTVRQIEHEAEITKDGYRGQKGKKIALSSKGMPLTVENVRTYIQKVLFLCNQIRKLKNK